MSLTNPAKQQEKKHYRVFGHVTTVRARLKEIENYYGVSFALGGRLKSLHMVWSSFRE